MHVRFDYSERISTNNLVASIKELMLLCNDKFEFNIVCKNKYIISIISMDSFYNKIVIHERRVDANYNQELFLVSYSFFETYSKIANIKEENNLVYLKSEIDEMLKDVMTIVNYLYVGAKANLII